ncbi:hypothetical protein [Archaeoglobus sp.]
MRGEKLTRKWRLIKLSRMQRSDFAPKFIEEYLSSVDGIEEMLYSYAVRYGVEKGEEVKRNITLKSFSDVAEFLGMISGVIVEKKNSVAVYSGCPSYMMTDVRKVEVCRGFIEGFFRAFNFLVEVRVKCGETCRIEVKLKD